MNVSLPQSSEKKQELPEAWEPVHTCSAHSVLKGLGYVDVLDCVFSANARELIFSSLFFLPSPASVFSS